MSAGKSTWTLCAVDGCRFVPTHGWPICAYHAIKIADMVATWDEESPPQARTVDQQIARQRVEEAERAKGRNRYGQIYYVRLNDLIKIGWSSQLQVRLRDYTPGAELLAHHPGTRRDEAALHRTFAYCRRHGREWYDGEARELNRHIQQMLDEWGHPMYEVIRSAPPSDSLRPRVSSRPKASGLSI